MTTNSSSPPATADLLTSDRDKFFERREIWRREHMPTPRTAEEIFRSPIYGAAGLGGLVALGYAEELVGKW